MNHTAVRLTPSGRLTIAEQYMGLSMDANSTKSRIAAQTRAYKEEWLRIATPPPVGPSCELKERKSYQPGRLTQHARQSIMDGCALITREYGSGNVTFFTATLPRFNAKTMKAIDEEWHEIVHLWLKKVRYHLKEGGAKEWVVHKTEWQADGTLHLHAIYPGRFSQKHPWFINIPTSDKLWRESVQNFVPATVSNDFRAANRVETVTGNAGHYMSKYMTKKSCETCLEIPTTVKRCWGSTRFLKKAVRDNTYDDYWRGERPLIFAIHAALAYSETKTPVSDVLTLPSGANWCETHISIDAAPVILETIHEAIYQEQNDEGFGFIPPPLKLLIDEPPPDETPTQNPVKTPLKLSELPF